MKRYFNLLLLAGAFAALQIGCGEDDGNNNTPPEDGGNGNDTSSGGDTDTGPPLVEQLQWDATTGQIVPNIWGINGIWSTYDDGKGSTVTGVVSDTGGYCMSGTVLGIGSPADYSIWGAGAIFSLCYDDAGAEKTISTCPTDMTNILGFRATITATAFPTKELRVQMAEKWVDASGTPYVIDPATKEPQLDDTGNPILDTSGAAATNRDENTFVLAVDNGGLPQDFLFSAASVQYDDSKPPLDPNRIRGLQFQVATDTDPITYNFCIENLIAITPDTPPLAK